MSTHGNDNRWMFNGKEWKRLCSWDRCNKQSQMFGRCDQHINEEQRHQLNSSSAAEECHSLSQRRVGSEITENSDSIDDTIGDHTYEILDPSSLTVETIVHPKKGTVAYEGKDIRKRFDGRHWRILCNEKGCDKVAQSGTKGLCTRHFHKHFKETIACTPKKAKTVNETNGVKNVFNRKICIRKGCDRQSQSSGFCVNHINESTNEQNSSSRSERGLTSNIEYQSFSHLKRDPKKSSSDNCSIDVNDVFEELKEENTRLLNELVFANKCLQVLTEFKRTVDPIFDKMEYNLETLDWDRYEKSKKEVEDSLLEMNTRTGHHLGINQNEWVEQTIDDSNFSTSYDVTLEEYSQSMVTEDDYLEETADELRENETIVFKKSGVKKNSKRLCRRKGCNAQSKTSSLCGKHYAQESRKLPISKTFDFKCEFCDFSHNNGKIFIDHQNQHEEGVQISSISEIIHDMIMYRCYWPECKYKTHERGRIPGHVKAVHTNVKDIACIDNRCDQMFHFNNLMVQHYRYVHLGQGFPCKWTGCDHLARTEGLLKQHTLVYHTKERNFICDWPECGLKFKMKGQLKTHLTRIHNGKRYRDVCNQDM